MKVVSATIQLPVFASFSKYCSSMQLLDLPNSSLYELVLKQTTNLYENYVRKYNK